MKIIGLTGGIGAGKTTVAQLFEKRGYGVYNSDIKAKELMTVDFQLKRQLIDLLGEEAYIGSELNKKWIAEKIFSDAELLKKQNALVHAAVRKDFAAWTRRQKGSFCVKEASILFESESYKSCDYTVVVTAPDEIRLRRAVLRDKAAMEEIKKRMKYQFSQEKLIELADFQIINNEDLEKLKTRVDELIQKIENLLQQQK
ncbi:MAG: dephospho-CoA kinase [Flavobacteriaceae bacterium]|jgi:dephospho-CoA kinase|nr:dephospho-CoA kinase [Flavobacteriaceae bacterium]